MMVRLPGRNTAAQVRVDRVGERMTEATDALIALSDRSMVLVEVVEAIADSLSVEQQRSAGDRLARTLGLVVPYGTPLQDVVRMALADARRRRDNGHSPSKSGGDV